MFEEWIPSLRRMRDRDNARKNHGCGGPRTEKMVQMWGFVPEHQMWISFRGYVDNLDAHFWHPELDTDQSPLSPWSLRSEFLDPLDCENIVVNYTVRRGRRTLYMAHSHCRFDPSRRPREWPVNELALRICMQLNMWMPPPIYSGQKGDVLSELERSMPRGMCVFILADTNSKMDPEPMDLEFDMLLNLLPSCIEPPPPAKCYVLDILKAEPSTQNAQATYDLVRSIGRSADDAFDLYRILVSRHLKPGNTGGWDSLPFPTDRDWMDMFLSAILWLQIRFGDQQSIAKWFQLTKNFHLKNPRVAHWDQDKSTDGAVVVAVVATPSNAP